VIGRNFKLKPGGPIKTKSEKSGEGENGRKIPTKG